ncbi:hypothetical protein [Rhizobium sp. SSA_523]|uniref:hypothetical protein n=1 Tax=Rhizobium sp. SSA_523 TaxID=2952477 RepID=UPI002091B62D|nr:hypothetical protein [Rhizobium sp. SSA_523]MCO5733088.1 hypothetical protein [Rhizobium sp. SSA_523]WKC23967.1 hypothetical protein QTJ18_24900 [Rhizobium sp. SSA_523]
MSSTDPNAIPATSPATSPAPSPASGPHPTASHPTASQVRGDIQQGLTGDKRPGIDPAAAPMETDAEAGGAPPTPEEIAMARASQPRTPGNEQLTSRNFDTAMQPAKGTRTKRPSLPALVPALVALAVILALALGYWLR